MPFDKGAVENRDGGGSASVHDDAGAKGGGGAAGGAGSIDGNIGTSVRRDVVAPMATRAPTNLTVKPVTVKPVVASSLGAPCRTINQTINIDGQDVHASAVVCRTPDGGWQIQTPTARIGNRMATSDKTYALSPPFVEE